MSKNIVKSELEQITDGVLETTTEFNATRHVQRLIKRKKAATRRAARKRARLNKRGTSSIEAPAKAYTVLVQYHQLNYAAIQEELKELKLKPDVIDNKRFWISNVDSSTLEALKEAMRKCHYETKGGKDYKVRLAAYKYIEKNKTETKKKKPTNNKPNVAYAAKEKRKLVKKKVATNRGRHLIGRKANKKSHSPAVQDTSSIMRKLKSRIKKAVRANDRREKDVLLQAKYRANKGIPQPKKGKQLEIAA